MCVAMCLELALCAVSRAVGQEGAALNLTESEQTWIAANRVLPIAVDPAWAPFSFIDKAGQHAGIDAELLAIIASRTGLRFELKATKSWAESEELGRMHKVRLLPGMARISEREAHFDFSQPYIKAPVAVIMRENAPFWTGLRSLDGRRVASPRGYAPTVRLRRDYPLLRIVETDNVRQSFDAVSRGHVDAVVENLVVATHTIKKAGLTNLKIVGLTDDQFELRLATPKGERELQGILNKAIGSISEREIFAIQDRWINVNAEDAINWRLVRRISWWVLGIFTVLVAGFTAWNRRLERELTERRRVESILRVREEELRATNGSLAALIQEKKILIGIAAHDLRNPLSAIMGASEVLREMPGQPQDGQHLLQIIHESGERMERMVKNLLVSEALENGPAVVRATSVDLTAIIADIVAQHRPRAREKKIALGWQPPDEPVRVVADADAVAQVIDNLVSNAVKFTPVGGSVDVRVAAGEKTARLTVEDSGPGIPLADQPRLFGRFCRLSTQPTGGESSHGLGLLIVQRFAEAMKGTVRYEDGARGGSRFVVELPLARRGDAAGPS